MNGRAKNISRLINRTNNCGGDNKAGLPSRMAMFQTDLRLIARHRVVFPRRVSLSNTFE